MIFTGQSLWQNYLTQLLDHVEQPTYSIYYPKNLTRYTWNGSTIIFTTSLILSEIGELRHQALEDRLPLRQTPLHFRVRESNHNSEELSGCHTSYPNYFMFQQSHRFKTRTIQLYGVWVK